MPSLFDISLFSPSFMLACLAEQSRVRCASSRHSLDSLLGDDPGGGSVENLLEALQLEPVHPAGQTQHAHQHTILPLRLSRLSVTRCYIRAVPPHFLPHERGSKHATAAACLHNPTFLNCGHQTASSEMDLCVFAFMASSSWVIKNRGFQRARWKQQICSTRRSNTTWKHSTMWALSAGGWESAGVGGPSSLHLGGQDCYTLQTDSFLWLFYVKATGEAKKNLDV